MSNYYNKKYFDSDIFQCDYSGIAEAIVENYHPTTIIEFGCGNGDLSKALYNFTDQITAIDGFSEPNFSDCPLIKFHKIDLNDLNKIKEFCSNFKKFDIAICMEVAEHLKPSISPALIEILTSIADVVVFSAAVPEQDGDGHINCQTRLYWHKLFEKNNFALADSIRPKISHNPKVAVWFRLNTVDYIRLKEPLNLIQYHQLVENLVAAESTAASTFYYSNRKAEYKDKVLNLDIVKYSLNLRNFIKRLIGRKTQ